ncbi:MAG TPA: phenylalanine--tRNA ligase subunit beta [Candidatus Omnitrophica bacterium]|nr:phenylalanine--tRNA ligase subunit beta [Candidatus Omnitrophota bacterium]
MKITYSWIKELVGVTLSPESLADKLSMAGLSVELLERVGDDWVYHIEVTSNRPDWLSVNGIVREIAAITNAKMKKYQVSGIRCQVETKKNLTHLSIDVEDHKDCAFYYGNLIAGVKVGPSPEWLKKRLQALGMRPVNNIVDITNYCLMETGQPLHAFDLDKITDSTIIVRRAKKGELIGLLDGTQRNLNEHMLVIADAARPIAVAGIMGGSGTEVCDKTANILLESAYFDPVVVRRASRMLGVPTDSSYRFERGVDVPTVKKALARATEMMIEIAGGVLVYTGQAGKAPAQKSKKISFCLSEALDTLGMEMTPAQAKNIFRKLGFILSGGKDRFLVEVPTTRRDIKIPEDLSEELVRVWGYDKIPLTAPAIKPFILETPVIQALEAAVKGMLTKMGLKEALTYSLTGEDDYKKTAIEFSDSPVELENPLTRDYRILRPTLIPSLLNCVSYNVNHNNKDLEFFEISRVFSSKNKQDVHEAQSLALVLCGDRRSAWSRESRAYTLFDLKGIIEAMLDELRIKQYEARKSDALPFAEKDTGCEIAAGKDVLATICKVSGAVLRAWGIKGKVDVFAAEVSLESLARRSDLKNSYTQVVSIPSVVRDVSVLAGQNASYGRIKAIIEAKGAGLVRSVYLADTYTGREVAAGQLGLTITIEYGSSQKTLTDEEVNSVHTKILEALSAELSLKIR